MKNRDGKFWFSISVLIGIAIAWLYRRVQRNETSKNTREEDNVNIAPTIVVNKPSPTIETERGSPIKQVHQGLSALVGLVSLVIGIGLSLWAFLPSTSSTLPESNNIIDIIAIRQLKARKMM